MLRMVQMLGVQPKFNQHWVVLLHEGLLIGQTLTAIVLLCVGVTAGGCGGTLCDHRLIGTLPLSGELGYLLQSFTLCPGRRPRPAGREVKGSPRRGCPSHYVVSLLVPYLASLGDTLDPRPADG